MSALSDLAFPTDDTDRSAASEEQLATYENASRLAGSSGALRVAESGSFTAVADRLNSTKSAVSQAVAVLERELGAQLLQRSTRKLAITEQGEAFLAACRCCRHRGRLDFQRGERKARVKTRGSITVASNDALLRAGVGR